MINPMDLTGKRILVTGASSGIGRQTCITLSQLGANVTLVARREEELKQTMEMMEGGDHEYCSIDLSKNELIKKLVDDLIDTHGCYNGFVHAAGIAPMRPLSQEKKETIDKTLYVNFYAFIELCKQLTKRERFLNGSIVGVSSISSIKGNKSKIEYCSSKAAMDAAIRCIANELGSKGIRVNSVMPGWVRTELYTKYMAAHSDTEVSSNIHARQFLGLIEPYEVANTIAYLLSDATRSITATSILIDGGLIQG